MKALFGLLQIGLGVVGVIALINGKWLWMIGAWVAAGLVGLAGNRAVRSVEGISELGRDAARNLDRAVDLLRRGDYPAAAGVTRSAVRDFRIGGDKVLLPLAMTLHAVALTSVRDVPGARQATVEAADRLRHLPPALANERAVLQQTLTVLQRQLNMGVPDSAAMVAEALAPLDSL